MECSHFSSAVQLTRKQVREVQPQQWNCAICRTQKSPWICLACGTVLCGRYVNGHAREHAKLYPNHCLCMDQGLTIYCYKDDEFIVNEDQVVQELRMEIERKMDPLRSPSSSPENTSRDCNYSDDLPPPAKMAKTTNSHGCPVRTCGLQNLGNTCFMNAILQPLNNLEQFCCFFKHLPTLELRSTSEEVKKHVHCYNTRRNGDTDKVSLVEEMGKISSALWQEDTVTHSPHSLFSVVWKLVPRFRGYQQQDAHEFMHYLLDKLHSELCRNLLLTPPSTILASSTIQSNPTIVSETFGGVLQSDVTCLTCDTESRKLDPILDISLEIPEAKECSTTTLCTLTDCLYRYTSKETLEETEWYYCTCCKKKQPSTKQLSLHSLPKVLCVHLKRFRFTSFLRTKVNTPISFPLHSLDLSPFTVDYNGQNTRSAIYDLSAVVVHHGSGASCGHYTAYVYSPNSGSWYHFNDSTVSETDSTRVSNSRPYILFYVQRESNSGYFRSGNQDQFDPDKTIELL